MTRAPQGALAGVLAAALFAPAAFAHPERQAFFPDGSQGSVPEYRATGGQRLVVCKRDSAERIRRTFAGRRERNRLRLLDKCRFRHIQRAVDAARNDARIKILPGVYREPASRRAPEPDPRCNEHYDEIGGGIGGATETKARVHTFGKSLWSPGRGPEQLPETELLRTGRIAWLDPGETVPFTLAWRGAAAPARIEYDGGWVAVP